MRLLALDRVEDGAELARDVVGGRPGAPPLLRAGVRMGGVLAARAAANGVTSVWVNDELGEGIEPPEPLPEGIRDGALRAIAHAHEGARRAIAAGRSLEPAALRELDHAAAGIAAIVTVHPCDPSDPAPADPQRQWHALRVATLGLALGARHLRALAGQSDGAQRARHDRLEERLVMLGAGLLAHDVGKAAVPEAILARTAPASPDEQRMLRRHTVLGEGVMTAAAVPVQVRSAVRGHHEHWDGSGYPDGKAGTAIHVSARIAAVADAYDALTAPRSYRPAQPPHAAVRAVEDSSGTRFDPAVVELFSALVLPFPLGHEVALPDGRRGVVAHVASDTRLRPTVRVRAASGTVEELAVDLEAQFAGVAAPVGAGA